MIRAGQIIDIALSFNDEEKTVLSSLMYIASNKPLEDIKNPHYKTLSVNEALAIGMAVPNFMLEPDFNRDEPGVLLWSDTEIILEAAGKEVNDGGLDDDFAILKLNDAMEDIYTEKKHLAYIEWMKYTQGRAEKIIDYVKRGLEDTDDIEIWHIWMGNEERPFIKKRIIPADEFVPVDLENLAQLKVWAEPITQVCLVITGKQSVGGE